MTKKFPRYSFDVRPGIEIDKNGNPHNPQKDFNKGILLWDEQSSMTKEDFFKIMEKFKKEPIRPTQYVLHVTKELIDGLTDDEILGIRHCQLIGSPEAIKYAEERGQAILKKRNK